MYGEEGSKLDRVTWLLLASVLAGFALLRVPLEGTFLASVEPVTDIIGILAVLVFSLFLIFNGIKALLGK